MSLCSRILETTLHSDGAVFADIAHHTGSSSPPTYKDSDRSEAVLIDMLPFTRNDVATRTEDIARLVVPADDHVSQSCTVESWRRLCTSNRVMFAEKTSPEVRDCKDVMSAIGGDD